MILNATKHLVGCRQHDPSSENIIDSVTHLKQNILTENAQLDGETLMLSISAISNPLPDGPA